MHPSTALSNSNDTQHVLSPLSLPLQLQLSNNLTTSYLECMLSLGRLRELFDTSPNKAQLSRAFSLKEALASSAIDGIHVSMFDLLSQERQAKPSKLAQRVLNYHRALQTAIVMVREEHFPIIPKVILKAHELLMQEEGEEADPGHYRREPIHPGSMRLGSVTPAAVIQIPELMKELSRYIDTNSSHPPLIQAGVAHLQLDTIHPFLEGNGRIGRLLTILMLIKSELITSPLLYPSTYFKRAQLEYYQGLDRASSHSEHEKWLAFYLDAITWSACDAYQRIKQIQALELELKKQIQTDRSFHKARAIALEVLKALFDSPVISIGELSQLIGRSYNATHHALLKLAAMGWLKEITSQRRNKLFLLLPYLELLEREIP